MSLKRLSFIKPLKKTKIGMANAIMALTLAIALNSFTILDPTFLFLESN